MTHDSRTIQSRTNRTGFLVLTLMAASLAAQEDVASSLLELMALRAKVGNADTRIRVDALHRVWSIALGSDNSQVKTASLDLLREPVGSSSDHIRIPAVYAIAEIANSTNDAQVNPRAGCAERTDGSESAADPQRRH